MRAKETGRQVKALTAKPDDLSLTSRTHGWMEKLNAANCPLIAVPCDPRYFPLVLTMLVTCNVNGFHFSEGLGRMISISQGFVRVLEVKHTKSTLSFPQ